MPKWFEIADANKDKILWSVKKTRLQLRKEQMLHRYATAEVLLLADGDIQIIWNDDYVGHDQKAKSIWRGSTANAYLVGRDVITWGQISANLIAAKP